MLPVLVVVDEEAPRGLADVIQSCKQIAIEHVLAVGAVEALDVGVLVRLAGLDVLDGYAAALGPGSERLAQEFRAVIRTTSPRLQ